MQSLQHTMLVTGSPTVSDDLGQRLSDSGKKTRDQSPTSTARRFFGAAGLQQLQQHLTRRSSSPLGRATVATTATAAPAAASSNPKSPLSSSPVVVVSQPPHAVDAVAAGPSGWASRTPSPPREAPAAAAALTAPTLDRVPFDAAAAADVMPGQQQLQEQPAAAAAGGEHGMAPQQPQLQPSPVLVMTGVTDAVVAAGSAEAHLTQHLAGKRKVRRLLALLSVVSMLLNTCMAALSYQQA